MPTLTHYRATFSGIFGAAAAPVEDWSFGVSLNRPGPGWVERGALLDACTALQNTWAQVSAFSMSTVRCQAIKVAAVNPDGKYARDETGAYLQGEKIVDLQGSDPGALKLPYQVSLAVTLHSQLDHATGRGRFFIPGISAGTLDADGRLSSGRAQQIRDGMVTWVKAVNDAMAPLGIGPVVVASGGSVNDGIPAANRLVTHVSVGRRLDIQRRRGNDQPEDRALAPVPA